MDVRPLQVVAVAEAELFWRDIRRVLFSGARYTILARLSRDGTQAEWMPVKLVELLKNVVPDLAVNFDGRGLLASIKRAQAETPALLSTGPDQVLLAYGELLGERYGVPVDTAALSVELRTALPQPTPFDTVPQQRTAFEVVTEWVRSQEEVPDEPEVLAELRETAMATAELSTSAGGETSEVTVDAHLGADASVASGDARTGEAVPLMLDTEVVGIYW